MQQFGNYQKRDFCKRHNEDIYALNLDDNVPIENRLLCHQCLNQKREVKIAIIANVKKTIETRKQSLQKFKESEIDKQTAEIISLMSYVEQIIVQIQQFADETRKIINQWVYTLTTIDIDNQEQELIKLIEKYYFEQFNEQKYIEQYRLQINNTNQQFSEQIRKELNKANVQQQITQLEGCLNFSKKLTLNCVQQFIENSNYCAFAFNNTGNILVQTNEEEVKIWEIQNKQLKPNPLKYEQQSGQILSLVFSKFNNWFVSGSRGKFSALICWKQQGKKWLTSKPYQDHSGNIFELKLNKKEDTLISCDSEGEIMTWKVDQQKNILVQLQQLKDGHQDRYEISGISLNWNENSLVSCGEDNKLILWQKNNFDLWVNKFSLNEIKGTGLCFVSDNQFILKTNDFGIMYVFTIVKNKLQCQTNLSINLNEYNTDQLFFPPIFLVEQNIIVLRHNKFVYFIKKNYDGSFSNLNNIEWHSDSVFGMISNDGKLFIGYDSEEKKIKFYTIDYL